MKEVVELIVRALVVDKDAVSVTEENRDRATIIHVQVAQPDVGKIIGRQGRTVRALRSLLHGASLKRDHRYVLEIVE